jgi:hypothetical protein
MTRKQMKSQESAVQAAAAPGATVFLRDAESAYAVPLAVLERHRIAPERRPQIVAALREQGAGEPPADAALYELTPEDLAPYRLSDKERQALEAGGGAEGTDVQGFGSIASPLPDSWTRVLMNWGVYQSASYDPTAGPANWGPVNIVWGPWG